MPNKKVCFKCKQEKDLDSYYKHKQMGDGYLNKCKDCTKKDVSTHSKNPINGCKNYDQYRQRNSIKRIFSHKYGTMKSRCTKENLKRSSFGKELLSKEEWLKWCYEEKNYQRFLELHTAYVASGFIRKLCPSIDRIDNSKGYFIPNLQWLTQSENSLKYNK